MKSPVGSEVVIVYKSRPARGGWIEIVTPVARSRRKKSRPARGGWIEIAV